MFVYFLPQTLFQTNYKCTFSTFTRCSRIAPVLAHARDYCPTTFLLLASPTRPRPHDSFRVTEHGTGLQLQLLYREIDPYYGFMNLAINWLLHFRPLCFVAISLKPSAVSPKPQSKSSLLELCKCLQLLKSILTVVFINLAIN